jgi:hypothetical protein
MRVREEWHLLKANCRIFVIPAQAGMTVALGLSKCHSGQRTIFSNIPVVVAYFAGIVTRPEGPELPRTWSKT